MFLLKNYISIAAALDYLYNLFSAFPLYRKKNVTVEPYTEEDDSFITIWIEPMASAGVDQYTFHVEPIEDIPRVCRKVRESGMKVGLAIKPATPVEVVEKYISLADMILVMTVEPGFGGQKFMENMMPKVNWLRKNYPELDVEVDGGVGPSTIRSCAEAGANMIVSGTAVIGADNPTNVINFMRDTVNSAIEKQALER